MIQQFHIVSHRQLDQHVRTASDILLSCGEPLFSFSYLNDVNEKRVGNANSSQERCLSHIVVQEIRVAQHHHPFLLTVTSAFIHQATELVSGLNLMMNVL